MDCDVIQEEDNISSLLSYVKIKGIEDLFHNFHSHLLASNRKHLGFFLRHIIIDLPTFFLSALMKNAKMILCFDFFHPWLSFPSELNPLQSKL